MAMTMNTLQDLFVEQLSDIYSAEKQLVKALPKMAQAATSKDLKDAFEMHLKQTQQHVDRIDQVFNQTGLKPMNVECEGMKGLIKEGEHAVKMQGDSKVKDAALIAAAQRVEHYEIAGYGTVRTFANHLGFDDAADVLQQTLDEEGQTDQMLTKLAEGGLLGDGINEEARRS